ncbi:transposable element Tcb1 transposase [Trichonephila clavipes]|nr:transposable element Tcb1 transposase [Trichonephila clavipes]
MQRDCALRIAGRWRLTSFSMEYKTGLGRPRQTSHREDRHIVRNARVQPTASSAAIQAQVAPSLEAPVSSRTIRRHPAEGHLGSRLPLRVLRCVVPLFDASVWSSTTHEKTGLTRNGSRSSLATNPDSISAVMTIVLVCGDPAVNASILPLLYSNTPLPQLPSRSPYLSPTEHIWYHLGRRVGHPTRLNELGARLQQLWNEMSQDIIQNLYASMPDRIASCIRARGDSAGVNEPLHFRFSNRKCSVPTSSSKHGRTSELTSSFAPPFPYGGVHLRLQQNTLITGVRIPDLSKKNRAPQQMRGAESRTGCSVASTSHRLLYEHY